MRERDAEAELNLPPGFRFHPTDEELVVHYLCRKASNQTLPVPIIVEIDLYKYDPWQLPEKALFGKKEWYFFTPRDRKYPNGSRPNRAAGHGYWKATGADKPIRPTGSTKTVGIKKALVFYSGKAPKGTKTDWIMHEYRLAQPNRSSDKKISSRLDDWVLCRIYNKKNNWRERMQHQMNQLLPHEPIDPFEEAEDDGSDSLRTPESDIDIETLSDNHDLHGAQGQGYSYQVLHDNNLQITDTDSGFPAQECFKEEDDYWFTNLNLEDLQNSLATFGTMPLPDFSYQDSFSMIHGLPYQPAAL
ncbi:hypothetical protein PVL29_006984 [Vitis rotundifolia]|nr:hypothetical protein PVL29_006984 [Vitis rotundifolia]